MSAQRDVTEILNAAADGDSRAAAELLPLVYDELRRLARSRMGNRADGLTLQPTALVHEAFLRLVGQADAGWRNRGHFFAAAAQAMRQIMVDQYRRRMSLKRGGDRARVAEDPVERAIESPHEDLMALDDALRRLEQSDARKAQIVNLRYFAGLTAEETAAAMGMSLSTIEREWRYIKRWLYAELSHDDAAP
ncbi:MAG: sigma-70 family RNA polymerase sigma factor [Phycisphaerae bacterium]|nr:sigma-70 family RNA polymerase sigma factor [Phycisphaerae bacterium]